MECQREAQGVGLHRAARACRTGGGGGGGGRRGENQRGDASVRISIGGRDRIKK